jgi:hypothetical protein
MRALFECRLGHIGRYDRVKVECACGREALLPLDAFNGLPSNNAHHRPKAVFRGWSKLLRVIFVAILLYLLISVFSALLRDF